MFGRHRLVTLLGEGGFAQTYLGKHFQLNIRVAVKVLISNDPDHVASFNQEMEILHGLNHLNIVHYMGDGEYRDPQTNSIVKYFIMSLLPNGSLAEKYPFGTQVPITTVCGLMNQLADGLFHVHDEGECVHCDVNPNNILFDQHDRPVLIDFGVAASFSGLPTKVVILKEAYGTLPYPAPEQYKKSVCPASDLYSLAVIAYELLTGESFTRGQSILTHPALSSAVETVLTKAVSENPNDRYSVITDFADALELAASTPVAKPVVVAQTIINPAPIQPVRPQVAQNRTGNSISKKVILIGICALLFLFVGVPVMVSLGSNPSHPSVSTTQQVVQSTVATKPPVKKILVAPTVKPTQKVPTPTPVPTKEPTKIIPTAKITITPISATTNANTVKAVNSLPVKTGIYKIGAPDDEYSRTSYPVSWSPNSTYIALGSTDDYVVQIINIATGHILYSYDRSVGTDIAFRRTAALAWSPNGKIIASFSAGESFRVVEVLTGRAKLFKDPSLSDTSSISWSPDGKLIAVGEGTGVIQVIDSFTGDTVHLYTVKAVSIESVSWSPDGMFLAFGNENSTVQVLDIRSGKVIAQHTGIQTSTPAIIAWSPDGKDIVLGGSDNAIDVWNVSSEKVVARYIGEHGSANTVAWSPDSKFVASGTDDGTVQVWNAVTGSESYIYKGHTKRVVSVSWSPNGKDLASTSDDGTLQVWYVGEQQTCILGVFNCHYN